MTIFQTSVPASLKSNKTVILFISQGGEFQMTGPKHLTELFSKYSVLIFGIQKSDFERDYAKLSFITSVLSKNLDARPYFILNISIANCSVILFSCIAQDLSQCKKFLKNFIKVIVYQ